MLSNLGCTILHSPSDPDHAIYLHLYHGTVSASFITFVPSEIIFEIYCYHITSYLPRETPRSKRAGPLYLLSIVAPSTQRSVNL